MIWQLSKETIEGTGDRMLLSYYCFLFRWAESILETAEEGEFETVYRNTENEILRRMKGEH